MIACILLSPGVLSDEALLHRLFTVSPLVELCGETAFVQDTGLQRLHGGPSGLFAAIRRALHPHEPRGLALAATRQSAELAARYAGRPVLVRSGEEALFLSRLPLTALPLEPALAQRLLPLGLETVGDFASLPVAAVESRYGAAGVALHRAARGADPGALLPAREPVARVLVRWLEEPASRLDGLKPALEELLGRLCAGLAEAGLGVLRLRLVARLDAALPDDDVAPRDERVDERAAAKAASWELSLPVPEDRAALLAELLAGRVERQPPPRAVAALRVQALQTGRMGVHQNALFGEIARDEARRQEALARLTAVLGKEALQHPRLVRDHRLEARWTADDARIAPERRGAPGGELVLRVLRPPQDIVPLLAGGELVGLRRGRMELQAARVHGPRRLVGGWWAQPWARDEYDVLTTEGVLLRVARDAVARRWLLLAEAD